MIIDCHGHFTTAPAPHQQFRDAQLAYLAACAGGTDPALTPPVPAAISDGAIRESIEANQLRLAGERGTDLTIFSPQASAMGHHVTDPATAQAWARACNDLIGRVTTLFPRKFAGVCQLPQVTAWPLDDCVAELDRCVRELGFVGCNLNPDPSGGYWTSPPLTDAYWFPLYEKMTELDVPAMIHVSASCNPAVQTTGAHYLSADTTVFMQLVEGDLFGRFPSLRFVIPHGGGAVPYHWGRFHGVAERLGRPPLGQHLMGNVFFDTYVYHQPGIDLLTGVIGAGNILFASEMLGAVRGINPDSGSSWDDTRQYVDKAGLSEADLRQVLELNARRVYPRLAARLPAPVPRSRLPAPWMSAAPGGSQVPVPDQSQVPELRDAVARACRILAMEGVADGVLGHVSVRDPGHAAGGRRDPRLPALGADPDARAGPRHARLYGGPARVRAARPRRHRHRRDAGAGRGPHAEHRDAGRRHPGRRLGRAPGAGHPARGHRRAARPGLRLQRRVRVALLLRQRRPALRAVIANLTQADRRLAAGEQPRLSLSETLWSMEHLTKKP